jgi:hypothetical protein
LSRPIALIIAVPLVSEAKLVSNTTEVSEFIASLIAVELFTPAKII